ncbi:MAG: hypothetical protein DCF18_07125 [Cyanobium sp.]|nr:MAG: hypothetical protein DCF18_07125 [Cyanobium sp.]
MPSDLAITMTNDLPCLSPQSLEVLSRLGPEAPRKLNTYACAIEDMLLESLEHQMRQAAKLRENSLWIKEAQTWINAAERERQALRALLTDPDELLRYVIGFFGADGPYPGRVVLTRLAEMQRS